VEKSTPRPRFIPAQIVVPERDTPGKIASICASPIKSACRKLSFDIFPAGISSGFDGKKERIIEVRIRPIPAKIGFSNIIDPKPVNLRKHPKIPAGKDEISR